MSYRKDIQYIRFCAYGFLKNLRFFEPFLYLFFLEKGLSYFQIGLLITIRELVQNFLEIPTGIMADGLGRRRTMISAFCLYIVAFIIFYLATQFWLFSMAMILFAMGDAFRTGTHKAMIFEYLRLNGWQKHKVDYYGHTRSWSQTGSAISSLLAASIVFWSGNFSSIFLFSTIPYLLDLLLMLAYPKELDGPAQTIAWNRFFHTFGEIIRNMMGMLRQRSTRRALSNAALFSGCFKVMKDYYQPVLAAIAASLTLHINGHLSDQQVTAIIIGGMYFVLYLGTSWSSRNAGRIAAQQGSTVKFLNRSLIAGLLLFPIIGIFYLLPSPWTWLVALPFSLVYLMENLRRPANVAWISESFPPEILATVLSVESQARGLLAALIAPVTGFMADKYGIATAMIILGIVLLALYPATRLSPKNS
jgi:MFS family permease